MKNVEELDLYKEYKFAYDKAHELEFFDKVQEALYYYEYAKHLREKIDNGETILYKVNFLERKIMKIKEALGWIDNSIEYWVMASEYDGKEDDVKKTDEAWNVIVKALKEKGKI